MGEHGQITVRGRDLATDLIGHTTFTELLLLDVTARAPTPGEVRMVDAVLVALMEHGLTPSSVATRLALDGAPDSTQGAIACGLLTVGARFLGVIEDVARLLQALVATEPDVPDAARRHVDRIRAEGRRVPGLGHNLLREDPRAAALLAVAHHEDVAGAHVDALEHVRAALAEATGRSLAVNATGAVGAILSDLGFDADMVRGFALVARCGGLVAHVADERRNPIGRLLWTDARTIKTTE